MNFNQKYRIIDISQEIYEDMPIYKDFQKTFILEAKGDADYKFDKSTIYTRNLIISEQGPTHSKAKRAYSSNSPSIDEMDYKLFYGDCICLDVSKVKFPSTIEVNDIKEQLEKSNLEIKKGDILLLYTGDFRFKYPDKNYSGNSPENIGVSYECIQYLAANGISNIGVDSPSLINPNIDKQTRINIHEIFKKYNMTCTLNLANLYKLVGLRFIYIGFPLKIKDGTASPVRALAMLEIM